MVYVVETRQSIVFALLATELTYRLLHALKGTAETPAAIFDDPFLVACELVNGLPRHDQADLARLNHLLESAKRRLIAIVLRHIEPNTSVN